MSACAVVVASAVVMVVCKRCVFTRSEAATRYTLDCCCCYCCCCCNYDSINANMQGHGT
jgi:hypothetical protein